METMLVIKSLLCRFIWCKNITSSKAVWCLEQAYWVLFIDRHPLKGAILYERWVSRSHNLHSHGGRQLYLSGDQLTAQRETNMKTKLAHCQLLNLLGKKLHRSCCLPSLGAKVLLSFLWVCPALHQSLVQPVPFASGCFPNWWRSLWIQKLFSRNLSTLSLSLSWNWLLICKLPFQQLWNRWRRPRSSVFTDHLSLFF